MSNKISLTELLTAIGDDHIKFQPLDSCMEEIKSSKGGSLITFGTQALTPTDVGFNTGPRGIIIWVDGDMMHQRMDELKAGNGRTFNSVVKQRDELLAALEEILLMLRKEPNTQAALMKAEGMLHQAIVRAKTGGSA